MISSIRSFRSALFSHHFTSRRKASRTASYSCCSSGP
uniref:Uncharacterized protein n=1 Tax=Myoviridae sp. ct4yW2 TaxID=2827286 RepID=A0A8S5R9F7_9CAUD|nr:MAG TPA: hypothetical protein [Myoviridae sp. ct4yW2]